jgi:predicted RNase H-like HicB family nuclease
MRAEIGDEAARVFAAQFYSAIGFGKSLKVAFEQAKAALMLEAIQEEDTPLLFVKAGLDAGKIVLVKE